MDPNRFESAVTKAAGDTPACRSVATYVEGEVINHRYKLKRELGRGGMGVVWAADALSLGVEVAVKLIQSDVTSNATVGRMTREAQAVAKLTHPSLVRVFDFGFTTHNQPYLVMELVRGETLRDALLRDGPMSALEAVKTVLPIADGLRLAHRNGIIHRDLKPDNVFIAVDELKRVQPKLLDFGVAKDVTSTSKLTQTGFVVGTPQYISPEQAQGLESVDQRSDVWSFCVMLYELLTGNLPFEEDNYNAQMFAIIARPPATPMPHTGDARLWRIVLRGLAKEPDERFQTMTELGEALATWLYEKRVKVDVAGNSLRSVWLDNAPRRNSEGPISKAYGFVAPNARHRNSRLPAGPGSMLRGALLVFAVAACVFGLFEVMFTHSASSGPAPFAAPASAHRAPEHNERVQVLQREPSLAAPSPAANLSDTRDERMARAQVVEHADDPKHTFSSVHSATRERTVPWHVEKDSRTEPTARAATRQPKATRKLTARRKSSPTSAATVETKTPKDPTPKAPASRHDFGF